MTQTIVVTGAGTGIGLAIAKVLAESDYALILLGRDGARLDSARLTLHHPDRHQCFSCDVRKKENLREALAKSQVTALHAVVVNAGIGGENQAGANDRWQKIIDTNLTGSYHTVQECLPYLKKNSDGFRKIVFISSILARLGVPGYSAYCASKAGILGLMRSLANELTRDKILVNALCPGWVNTDMAHEGLQAFADFLKISKTEAERQAMSQVPLGKMSEPHEIARLVQFLISDAQTSITGQTLDINNGGLMP